MFLQEINNHDNIIKLLNVIKAENNFDIYLVFEFMQTDLHSVIQANILEPVHKQYIMYQLLKALKFLHSGDVIHRDLKPRNILLSSDCRVKLCDFGLARSLAQSDCIEGPNVILTDYVGTRWYRAPEIIIGSETYSKSVDMWSCGCILAEMLSGKPLFPGSSIVNQLHRILEVIVITKQKDIESLSSWGLYPTSIPNKKRKILIHNASKTATSLITKLIQWNPEKRIEVETAIKHSYLSMFHNPHDEPRSYRKITLPIHENALNVTVYRKALEAEILKRNLEFSQKMKAKTKIRKLPTKIRSDKKKEYGTWANKTRTTVKPGQ